MKVALLVPRLAGGGAERVVLHLARGLMDRGHQVELVLFRAEGEYLDEVPSGVTVRELGPGPLGRRTRAVARYLVGARPDLLLSFMSHANVPAGLARAVVPHRVAPLVVGTEHSYWERSLEWKTGRPRHAAYNRLIRFAYQRLDGVAAVSDGISDRLAEKGMVDRHRVVTVPNPVVVPDEAEGGPGDERHHPWPTTLLTVGRLHPKKDQATALRVVAKLRTELDVGLIILGQGPEHAGLVALADELGIRDRVRFAGFTEPWHYYRGADAFLLTSVAEGQPLVLIEALAHGLPVVSTDCQTGPAEILGGGEFGRLAPVGDVDALVDAVRETLQDRELDRRRLEARASDFSIEAAVETYLGFFHRLRGGAGPAGEAAMGRAAR